MNISSITLQKSSRRNYRSKSKKIAAKSKAIFIIILLLLATFAIVNLRVALNDRANRLERESIEQTAKLARLNREIENLQVKRAQLRSDSYIRSKLAQFKLKLRLPYPGQVVQLGAPWKNRQRHLAQRRFPERSVALR